MKNRENLRGFIQIVIILVALVLVAAGAYYFGTIKGKSTPIEPTQTPIALIESSSTPTSTPVKSPNPKPVTKPTPVPTATPYGLNDPVSSNGHCYPPEKPYADNIPINSTEPAKGSSPLIVKLYAYEVGFDYQYGSTIGYQWDFDGNGTWDTNLIPLTGTDFGIMHTYSQPGTFIPKYRARSNKNTWTPTCTYKFSVVVSSTKPEYENEVLIVDRVNPSVTISKSNQQKTIGFTVSTKDKFVPVRFEGDDINNYNHSYGITESGGADLDAGRSFDFHLFVNQSTSNGTYNRDVTLKYATGNGTIWNNGPTIHYTITVTD